ncbi:glycosyltransferase family 2 protein [Cellulomonas sp.]|uniref:glycosyltransferase family 2 protein n=1 Tax=Cellulomonas sp. TaxID=40001 RepID=UPI00258A8684|nr:glycosyltransferase family 2 protein [Cellulomonas sp.]MCR6690546.1 glycosyltransferase [Cellulomonas sp.]
MTAPTEARDPEALVAPGGATGPDVSVVVPTHDVVDWIDECLTSLLEDQDVALEVVVVDDASRDGTYERALERAAQDPRLRVVRNAGVGGGQARNHGVALARGRYLAFADGDDIVPAGAYAAMLASARRSGADLVVGDFYKFSAAESWRPAARWPLFERALQGTTLAATPSLIRNRACWNRLFRRDFWTDAAIAFPSVPRSNDVVPMVTALTAARSVDVVRDIVYLYRSRPGTTSMTSRASADDSVSSYLSQELLCAELVGAVPSAELARTYWSMVLDADGWVHLRTFARSVAANGADPASQVPALVRQLLDRRLPAAWDRVDADRQVVYTLVAHGELDRAAQVVAAMGEQGRTPVAMSPVSALEAAVRVAQTLEVGEDALRRFVQRHVLEGLAARDEPLTPADATRAVELAAGRTWFVEPVAQIERPVEAAVRHALVAGDVAALTAPRARLVPMKVRQGVLRDTSLELVLDSFRIRVTQRDVRVRAVISGRPETMHDVAVADTSRPDWVATVTARALGEDGKWLFEVVYDTEHGRVQVPLEVVRGDIRSLRHRWGRLVVRGARRGQVPLVVLRVPNPVRRVAVAVRRRGVGVLLRLPRASRAG